ncbi:MAG: hypothetical protein J7641_05155 [Cyanobacteria bacterium SID2]|nr:hypothetical protein [Cyanobacteria bacterium SID2]MBP0006253.1 hypothetical protein [Cyanobacteria bacterium SBC]
MDQLQRIHRDSQCPLSEIQSGSKLGMYLWKLPIDRNAIPSIDGASSGRLSVLSSESAPPKAL